jgi:hypothetical protein
MKVIFKIIVYIVLLTILSVFLIVYNMNTYDNPMLSPIQLGVCFILPWVFTFSKWAKKDLWK